jgi:hypothetical protein
MSQQEDLLRYKSAAHGMQSGVAMEMSSQGDNAAAATPKHLRVGVNSALVETSAIAKLLIDKGIITEDEWVRALADGMEEERARYEKKLSALAGAEITLR